jgi:hypothetical protein
MLPLYSLCEQNVYKQLSSRFLLLLTVQIATLSDTIQIKYLNVDKRIN